MRTTQSDDSKLEAWKEGRGPGHLLVVTDEATLGDEALKGDCRVGEREAGQDHGACVF